MSLAATQSRLATGGRDDWWTPIEVLARVRAIGRIALDPCTSQENPVNAASWITAPGNGLAQSWAEPAADGLVFVNPPYSQMKAWAEKIAEESRNGIEIVSLVAARPDSRWFCSLVWASADAVCFWRGRLRFTGAPSSAPFPSAIVYHGSRPWAFEAAFHDAGEVLRL